MLNLCQIGEYLYDAIYKMSHNARNPLFRVSDQEGSQQSAQLYRPDIILKFHT